MIHGRVLRGNPAVVLGVGAVNVKGHPPRGIRIVSCLLLFAKLFDALADGIELLL
jgi:hypothetical protein